MRTTEMLLELVFVAKKNKIYLTVSMHAFCQAIQFASPINSHVKPYPAYMPGYEDDVIMAAGTFIQGASMELTADGPIRPPYVAYVQGGLTYSHVKIAVLTAISQLMDKGLLKF